jgi:prepilin signal peptidase PulO-like enzyme (type II secretory pathway)
MKQPNGRKIYVFYTEVDLFKTYPLFSFTLSYQSLLKAEVLMKHILIVLTRHQKVNDNRKLTEMLPFAPFLMLFYVVVFFSPFRWSS